MLMIVIMVMSVTAYVSFAKFIISTTYGQTAPRSASPSHAEKVPQNRDSLSRGASRQATTWTTLDDLQVARLLNDNFDE